MFKLNVKKKSTKLILEWFIHYTKFDSLSIFQGPSARLTYPHCFCHGDMLSSHQAIDYSNQQHAATENSPIKASLAVVLKIYMHIPVCNSGFHESKANLSDFTLVPHKIFTLTIFELTTNHSETLLPCSAICKISLVVFSKQLTFCSSLNELLQIKFHEIEVVAALLEPLSSMWINLNPSVDKFSHGQ